MSEREKERERERERIDHFLADDLDGRPPLTVHPDPDGLCHIPTPHCKTNHSIVGDSTKQNLEEKRVVRQ